LLALVWPISSQNNAAANRDSLNVDENIPKIQDPENLTAFLESQRWGRSLQDFIQAIGEREAGLSGLNPILKEMGYVGLISSDAQKEVLLTLPDGGVRRIILGDELLDGRRLLEINKNSLVLINSNEEKEVLLLFPEVESKKDSEETEKDL
jgi:hypothetical protein